MDEIHREVRRYYEDKLQTHGVSPRGVDWKDAQSQELRFKQFLGLFPQNQPFGVLDFGCGYAAFLEYLRGQGIQCGYAGMDLSPAMIATATERHALDTLASFRCDNRITPADFIVASGVFNVRQESSLADWARYIQDNLEAIAANARLGFGVNFLSSYSDLDKQRADLYYADPLRLFDWAKRHVAKNVALLHDYGLYEFTLLVRKETPQ